MKTSKDLTYIGRAERVRLIDHGSKLIPAKIDTGADVSSVWATQVKEHDHSLSFVMFGKKSPYYTGKVITLPRSEYRLTRIANSFGDKELRYVVKLRVEVRSRLVQANFTLANRSRKTYPILLGRRLLRGKFLVDVSQGDPLTVLEKSKKNKLRTELAKRQG